jgi:hypothetical protein
LPPMAKFNAFLAIFRKFFWKYQLLAKLRQVSLPPNPTNDGN